MVLVQQLANEEPLTPKECVMTISFDTDQPAALFQHLRYWRPLTDHLKRARSHAGRWNRRRRDVGPRRRT